MRSSLSRIARIEHTLAERDAEARVRIKWRTEDELADDYEQWHAVGGATHEPDFPVAIAFLRESLARARASADPPFDPPADWRPGARDQALTARDWRAGHFPDIRQAIEWLQEMEFRSLDGVPPVAEAEFTELAGWFERNKERLYTIQRASGTDFITLDNGRRFPVWYVAYDVRKGARAEGAGKAAEDIRQLMVAYPEATPVQS